MNIPPQDLRPPSDPRTALAMPGEWEFVKRVEESPAAASGHVDMDEAQWAAKVENDDAASVAENSKHTARMSGTSNMAGGEFASFKLVEKTQPIEDWDSDEILPPTIGFKKRNPNRSARGS